MAKGWPQEFTDEERDNVIKWYLPKAGVDSQRTATHGKYVHGSYRRSPVTIMHWNSERAKRTFEQYIYKRYNKQRPVTIWDTSNRQPGAQNQLHTPDQ